MTATITGNGIDKVQSGVIQNASLAAGVPSAAKLPAGTVLQVVTANTNTITTTTSTSWTDTALTLSITPTSNTSKIFLLATATVGMETGNVANMCFTRNSTQLNTGGTGWGASFLVTGAYGAGYGYPWSETWVDSPATTSATTYKVQVRVDSGGPINFNGRGYANSGTAVLVAMEIAA